MLTIDFQQIEYLPEADSEVLLEKIENVILYAYDKLKIMENRNLEMSVIFVDNAEIQVINEQYRDKDMATDVISFAFSDSDDSIIYDEIMPQILGEIFISVEKAIEQAGEYKHSFERELIFLALHGFLHLLGFDHIDDAEAEEMFGLQREILEELGIHR